MKHFWPQMRYLLILTNSNSDKFQFWKIPILTNSNSDKFRFWQFPILTNSNSNKFQFWQIPILTNSDSYNFQFWQIPILTNSESDKFQSWPIPILTNSSHPSADRKTQLCNHATSLNNSHGNTKVSVSIIRFPSVNEAEIFPTESFSVFDQ